MADPCRPGVPSHCAPGESHFDAGRDVAASQTDDARLDRVNFVLAPEAFDGFVDLLDNPPPPSEALRELLLRPAPWE